VIGEGGVRKRTFCARRREGEAVKSKEEKLHRRRRGRLAAHKSMKSAYE